MSQDSCNDVGASQYFYSETDGLSQSLRHVSPKDCTGNGEENILNDNGTGDHNMMVHRDSISVLPSRLAHNDSIANKRATGKGVIQNKLPKKRQNDDNETITSPSQNNIRNVSESTRMVRYISMRRPPKVHQPLLS